MLIPLQVGDIHPSKNSGEFTITELNCYRDMTVKFTQTGFTRKTNGTQVRKGTIKDPYSPRIYNIGYFGEGRHKSKVNGRQTTCYNTWSSMLERCYSPQLNPKNNSYIGCSVTPNWHNFQNFAEWYKSNYVEGWFLDKDILVENNRVYSASTCVFVDAKLNGAVVAYSDTTGSTKIGSRFQARILVGGKTVSLGCFSTAVEAGKAWSYMKALELIKYAYYPTTPKILVAPLLSRAVNLTKI